jgi:hypothetical protein
MSAPFSPSRRAIRRQSFDTITRYWNDPAFAAAQDAEGQRLNAQSMAAMDAGIAKHRRERAEHEHALTLMESNDG